MGVMPWGPLAGLEHRLGSAFSEVVHTAERIGMPDPTFACRVPGQVGAITRSPGSSSVWRGRSRVRSVRPVTAACAAM